MTEPKASEHDLREGSKPEVNELALWLESEASNLIAQANARRGQSRFMRNATVKELRAGKALAEKIAGRKLPLATVTLEAAKDSADMEDHIAEKLERQAKQFSEWGTQLAAILEENQELSRLLELANKPEKALEDALTSGEQWKLRAKEAETENQRLAKELEGFKALEAHLPKGYAIGDDATAELAVKLGKMREALTELIEPYSISKDIDWDIYEKARAALG